MLTPGMVLAIPVYHAGRLLLKAGITNIEKYKNELFNTGITYVYIEDENSEGIVIPDVITEELRTECKQKLREVFQQFAKRDVINAASLSSVIEQIITEILTGPDAALSLSDISSRDDSLVTHSVNCTVLGGLLGKRLGYDKAMLQKLLYGLLLHDIGKVKLPPKLFLKRTSWDSFETAEYHTHPTLGYAALKKCTEITELSKLVALTHHQRLDGSGYPNKATAVYLHDFAKIAAIVDEFDIAVSGIDDHREKWSVNRAVEYLTQESASRLDASFNALFIQCIAIYPNGSLVRLSDNRFGLVKEQNKNLPYRPVIRILTDETGKPGKQAEVNLLKELSLTILDSEMELRETGKLFHSLNEKEHSA